MNGQTVTDEQLWDFIDGLYDAGEQAKMNALLASDPALKTRYESLMQLHQELENMPLDEPSMRFTKNILEHIVANQYWPAYSYINKWIVRGIAALFLFLIGIMIAISLRVPGTNNNHFINSITTKTTGIFSGRSLQYLCMINVVGFLVLLDAFYSRKKTRKTSL